MGVSTNAYLVYGVMLKEGSFSSLGGDQAEPGTPKSLAYRGDSHNGIRILRHCSDTDPEYIVCAAEPWHVAIRGYPEKIHPLNLAETPPAGFKIMDYCKEHGLQTEGRPGWLLCSYWG
jgi:hypothetical protein